MSCLSICGNGCMIFMFILKHRIHTANYLFKKFSLFWNFRLTRGVINVFNAAGFAAAHYARRTQTRMTRMNESHECQDVNAATLAHSCYWMRVHRKLTKSVPF